MGGDEPDLSAPARRRLHLHGPRAWVAGAVAVCVVTALVAFVARDDSNGDSVGLRARGNDVQSVEEDAVADDASTTTTGSEATGSTSTTTSQTSATTVPKPRTSAPAGSAAPPSFLPHEPPTPPPAPPPDSKVVRYPVPSAQAAVHSIALGPDGNMWFGESNHDVVARITPSGTITEFRTPTAGSQPFAVAAGPDGNMWFTETGKDKIGRITMSGHVDEFPVPTQYAALRAIAAGPDGNMWFTEWNTQKVGRITMAGVVTEFDVGLATPGGITAGPDGAMWFLAGSGVVGRIAMDGNLTTHTIPNDWEHISGWLTQGPDGSLRFGVRTASAQRHGFAKMTTAGVFSVVEHATIGDIMMPAVGSDGAMWFAVFGSHVVKRLASNGTVTEIEVGGDPYGLAPGPGGTLWFTDPQRNAVGRIRI